MPGQLSLSLASAIAAVVLATHSHLYHHQGSDDDNGDDVDLRSVLLVSAEAQGVRPERLSSRVDLTLPGLTCRHEFT